MIILFDGDSLCWKASTATKDLPEKAALRAIDNMISKAMELHNTFYYRIALSSLDKSNFRYKIAKTKPYKGNRPKEKPKHWGLVREKLINIYGAEQVWDMEADDWLGIQQCKNLESNIISIIYAEDKDLKQIPGLHSDFDGNIVKVAGLGNLDLIKKSNKWQIKGTGVRWFYAQTIKGDSVDNIPGVPRKGDVAAWQTLMNCETEEHLWKCTMGAFGDNIEYFTEMANLCWIKRHESDKWVEGKLCSGG